MMMAGPWAVPCVGHAAAPRPHCGHANGRPGWCTASHFRLGVGSGAALGSCMACSRAEVTAVSPPDLVSCCGLTGWGGGLWSNSLKKGQGRSGLT